MKEVAVRSHAVRDRRTFAAVVVVCVTVLALMGWQLTARLYQGEPTQSANTTEPLGSPVGPATTGLPTDPTSDDHSGDEPRTDVVDPRDVGSHLGPIHVMEDYLSVPITLEERFDESAQVVVGTVEEIREDYVDLTDTLHDLVRVRVRETLLGEPEQTFEFAPPSLDVATGRPLVFGDSIGLVVGTNVLIFAGRIESIGYPAVRPLDVFRVDDQFESVETTGRGTGGGLHDEERDDGSDPVFSSVEGRTLDEIREVAQSAN
jgi:hypothetical protein